MRPHHRDARDRVSSGSRASRLTSTRPMPRPPPATTQERPASTPGRDRNLGRRRTAPHAIRACAQVLRVSGRPGPARLIAPIHRVDHRHCQAANHLRSRHESPRRARRPIPSQRRRGVPIACEDRLVLPDVLGTSGQDDNAARLEQACSRDSSGYGQRAVRRTIHKACHRSELWRSVAPHPELPAGEPLPLPLQLQPVGGR